MSESTDRAISALRTGHDRLVGLVGAMSPQELGRYSAATEWTIADVLSHLGSGAEIMLGSLDAALGIADKPGPDFAQSIWDRWNALTPQAQTEGFVAANDRLVSRFESLDAGQREELRVDLGFLPAPVDVVTTASLRLSEFTLHTWDVAVVDDPAATLAPEAREFLFEPLRMLIGWGGKPDVLGDDRPVLTVRTTDPDQEFGLDLRGPVSMGQPPAEPGPTLTLPAEAYFRLAAGRLAPEHTPPGITLDAGDLTLDDLRRVFPGY